MHDAKTILFASLTTVLTFSFLGVNSSFAEVPKEIRYRALEGKHIWEKLEYVNDKSKTEKTSQDKELAVKLKAQFENITAELNEYGIASPAQWEEYPDYWRMKNAPPMFACTNTTTLTNDTGTTGASSDPCFCPQEFRFIAGFDYKMWGFWPTSALSDSDYESARIATEDMVSAVMTKAEHAYITPFSKFGIIKEGFAKFKERYSSENPSGSEIDDTPFVPHTMTKAHPDYKTVYYDEIKNPPIGTDIQIIVDLH